FVVTHPLPCAGDEIAWGCEDSRVAVSLWNAELKRANQSRFAPDGSLWAVELRGRLRRLTDSRHGVGALTKYEFGKFAQSSDPQMGATSLLLAPDFDGESGTIYVAHNWDEHDGRFGAVTRVVLSKSKPLRAEFAFGPIESAGAHQVDRLAFDGDGG